MKRGAEHGKNVHGMKDEEFTHEFMQKEDLFVPPKNFFLFVQKDWWNVTFITIFSK